MVWSTKQVSSDDGSDWSPSLLQDQRPLPLKGQHRRHQSTMTTSSKQVTCPRCGSTHTKFCYYNNYNKSQPRHYCKTCKRHWTYGGTLRNVPVGGSRKNKRPRRKTSPFATITNMNPATSVTTSNTSPASDRIDQQKHQQLICPQPSQLLRPAFHSTTSTVDRSVLHDLDDQFPWSYSSPFEVSSWQNPILTGTATMPMSFGCHQRQTFSGNVPETAGNNMNWDELDQLVSANLNFTWDDIDVKLP